MSNSISLQVAIVLVFSAILYGISPLETPQTLIFLVPVAGALLGTVVFRRRPKTGAAVGFLVPVLIMAALVGAWLFFVFVLLKGGTFPT